MLSAEVFVYETGNSYKLDQLSYLIRSQHEMVHSLSIYVFVFCTLFGCIFRNTHTVLASEIPVSL